MDIKQWFLSLLAQYAGPCLGIVLFVDLFKQLIPKAKRRLVCRTAVFVCACCVAIVMRHLRGFDAWDAFVQGSILTVLAILCYDCGAYPKLKKYLQAKFRALFRGVT